MAHSSFSFQYIYEKCRRTNINPIVIKGLKRKPSEPVNEQPLLRSEKQFDFKEDCLISKNIWPFVHGTL
jgi:hypothetical protein